MGHPSDHLVALTRTKWRTNIETFISLFGKLIVFVYHCFNRIIINGYLSIAIVP